MLIKHLKLIPFKFYKHLNYEKSGLEKWGCDYKLLLWFSLSFYDALIFHKHNAKDRSIENYNRKYTIFEKYHVYFIVLDHSEIFGYLFTRNLNKLILEDNFMSDF